MQRVVYIGVDRQRMFKGNQVCQSQTGRIGARSGFGTPPARRKCAQVAVRERQHHQVSRSLAQILWCVGFIQTVAFAKNNMHFASGTQRRSNRFGIDVVMLGDYHHFALS